MAAASRGFAEGAEGLRIVDCGLRIDSLEGAKQQSPGWSEAEPWVNGPPSNQPCRAAQGWLRGRGEKQKPTAENAEGLRIVDCGLRIDNPEGAKPAGFLPYRTADPASSTSFATVFMLRAVPAPTAGILSFDRAIPPG